MNIKKLLLLAAGIATPLVFLFYPVSFLSSISCAPTEYAKVPTYSDLYVFPTYKITSARPPGSVALTILLVDPKYKDTHTQAYASAIKVSNGGQITQDMLNVFNSFSGSLGNDIEALLVAKGITVKGPFRSDEITYPDQKNSDLELSIDIIFDINYAEPQFVKMETYQNGGYGKVYSSVMSTGIKVYYTMLEPLSGEKMWIKSLDLGVDQSPFTYAVKEEQYVAYNDACTGPVYDWRDTNSAIYDERPKIFSAVLKKAYPQIMKTAMEYLNTDEMLNLKQRSQEIRRMKRY